MRGLESEDKRNKGNTGGPAKGIDTRIEFVMADKPKYAN